ncbi:Hsp20/alpha crystallin family protein [Chamaesiphon sp.]|uniref:Hsp20/alpha crystallin family protein n=1 Tax=Chamaesiphon sp. TaxID=2814140 RepID=UPI0035946785
MALVRLQPFRKIDTLQREMDRLFESLTDRDEPLYPTAFAPAAELHIDRENVYLQLEVPGLTPEEIEVQVTADSVIVDGERKEEKHVEEQGIKRSEFRYGKFHRTIALPEKVQRDRVQAKYAHGILKLTLPKAEDEQNKTVKVLVEA